MARVHGRAYAPFLQTVGRYPAVKFSLHVSGSLLEWLEREAAPTVALIREMAARGQCEILGGTYYEALAPVAPEHDVRASIVAYGRKLKEVFGTDAKGMWLAERVYEPHLPRLLCEVGVSHTALDDWHFRAAGIPAAELGRPWLVEHQGAALTVCPVSQRLRYLVPFAPVDDVVAWLRETYDAGVPMACLADDGEKFGEWPGTFEHCYEGGWLDEFFSALEDSRDWLRVATLGEAVAAVPAKGPAYLPATSYFELTRWALPTESQRRLADLGPAFAADGVNGDLATGAAFRSFFQKYPEANFFHKRVQELSRRAEEDGAQLGADGDEIRRRLWRAEANDAYWHGVFGGFYLPHLRRGVKEEFVRAEDALDRRLGTVAGEHVDDVDADGVAEIILKNSDVVAILKADGLAAAEFTRRSPPAVLTDVPARRPEPYHDELKALQNDAGGVKTIHAPRTCKEPGLEEYLVFDRRPKRLFLERVFEGRANAAAYGREEAREFAPFCWGEPVRKAEGWRIAGTLAAAETGEIHVEKGVALTTRGLAADLVVRSTLAEPSIFGLECSLGITSESPEYSVVKRDREYRCDEVFEAEAGALWLIADYLAGWQLAVELEPACALWHAPLYTVSCSERGFEKVYQGSSFFFWRNLPAGDGGFEGRFAITLD
jgi:hypothetical protein